MPFLSIIVPVYKVEQYLSQCINSILSQTFKDFELILVNDGSPDNCPSICDKYEKKDVRVQVIHKSNGGLVSARKAGLKVARGKYVGFVDSDDWIDNTMYENLCMAATSFQTDIVMCDIIHSYSNREVRHQQSIKPGLYKKKDLEEQVYPYMMYSGVFYKFGVHPAVWNKIFKRELLERNLYKVNDLIRMGEDAACTYPCLLDANSIYLLDNKYLYHYRQTDNSMTSSYDSEFLNRIMVLYKLLIESNKEKGNYDLTEQLHYYLVFLVIASLNNEFNENNKKSSYVKYKYLKNISKIQDIQKALVSVTTKEFPVISKLYTWLLRNRNIGVLYFVISIISKRRNYKKRKLRTI